MVQIGQISIGQAAKRSGVSTATLRFYEEKGLICSHRNAGNQRFYHKATLRIIAIIKVAQTLGFSLQEIQQEISQRPNQQVLTQDDWSKISLQWRAQLEQRIQQLGQLRNVLDDCIGCGCLSLEHCKLYNPDDKLKSAGPGARLLIDPTN